jgi:hypothetical protein
MPENDETPGRLLFNTSSATNLPEVNDQLCSVGKQPAEWRGQQLLNGCAWVSKGHIIERLFRVCCRVWLPLEMFRLTLKHDTLKL